MSTRNDDVYVNTPKYVFMFDLTSWGWIQLVLGVIAMVVSAGLFSRAILLIADAVAPAV